VDLSSPPLIEFRAVTKVYGSGEAEVRALDGVDLSIARGEFVAIMGPSGSGKSTAMNIMGCLDVPTSGDYLFQGVAASRLNRDERTLLRRHMIGFVFQGFNLLARTTAVENVELPLIYRGMNEVDRRRLALQALGQVGPLPEVDVALHQSFLGLLPLSPLRGRRTVAHEGNRLAPFARAGRAWWPERRRLPRPKQEINTMLIKN